jgi:hypothetical protein
MPQKEPLILSRLPYRGFASRIFMPFEQQLAAMGDKMPYAFLLFDSATMVDGGFIGAQQTANGYTSQPEDCWITHLTAMSYIPQGDPTVATKFVFQIYDADRQKLWTPQPINSPNGLGTAGEPMWLKKLYRLPASQQLQCQVTSLEPVHNSIIQVVAWGVRN